MTNETERAALVERAREFFRAKENEQLSLIEVAADFHLREQARDPAPDAEYLKKYAEAVRAAHCSEIAPLVTAVIRSAISPSAPPAPTDYIDIVFDGPPSHESGRFVEVERADGRSMRLGEWVHRPDGFWALRFKPIELAPAPPAPTDAEVLKKVLDVLRANAVVSHPTGWISNLPSGYQGVPALLAALRSAVAPAEEPKATQIPGPNPFDEEPKAKNEQPPAAIGASPIRTERYAVKSEESSAVSQATDRNTGDGSNPSAGGHPAPPAASEPDVFERVARECVAQFDNQLLVADVLRARFGECVEALEKIAKFPCGGGAPTDYRCGECAWCVAKDALASLRERKEQG